MAKFNQVKLFTDEDRKLLSDLSNTFDLGTKSLIAQYEDEIVYELSELLEDNEIVG